MTKSHTAKNSSVRNRVKGGGFKEFLQSVQVETSAPCRIDLGGTLDIKTFYYPLRHLSPCTFNVAVDLRTKVRLRPYHEGRIKVSSAGFESTDYPLYRAPFDHPLGLMFAIASYFSAGGVHIAIQSSSPPRSALGGSSAAAVALVGAFSNVLGKMGRIRPLSRQAIVRLAHEIEESVAGVPCGLQDQLAAAYGGVNAWFWQGEPLRTFFRKKTVIGKSSFKNFEQHLALAYCGVPHESKDINLRWVKQFLAGDNRELWAETVVITKEFIDALLERNYKAASSLMNRETAIRRKMTSDVLDEMGEDLVDAAIENTCGARFTGAGGGGCIWAIGEIEPIDELKKTWRTILSKRKEARLLDVKIDPEGIVSRMDEKP